MGGLINHYIKRTAIRRSPVLDHLKTTITIMNTKQTSARHLRSDSPLVVSGYRRIVTILAVAISFTLASISFAADIVVKVEDGGSPAEGASVRVQDNLTSEFVSSGRVSGGEFTASGLTVGKGYTIYVSYNQANKINPIELDSESKTVTFSFN